MAKKRAKRKSKKQNKKSLESAVYGSAILLALGVFLPLTRLPLYGDVSYNNIAQFESYLVVFFALLAPLLIFNRKCRLLIFAPLGAWITLLFPAIKDALNSKENNLLGKIGDSATSKMSDFAADMFLHIDNFSWGGFVFLFGLLLFTGSCFLRSLKK